MINNNSTAKYVKEEIINNPILINYLKRNLINISSLSRELLGKIKRYNSKATIESISIAIKRFQKELKNNNFENKLREVIKNIQIVLRDDLILLYLEYRNNDSKNIINYNNDNLFNLKFLPDDILLVNYGINDITLILDKKNEKKINLKIIEKKEKLSLISLKGDYRDSIGFVNLFLNRISMEGINIVDMISTKKQFNFIVNEKDAIKVFEICKNIKSNMIRE